MSGVQILDRFAHLYDFSIPGPSLESLPQSPDDEDLTSYGLPELDTGSKFIFPAPLDDDSSTVEPGSNTTSEAELEYDDEFSAPALANDPRNKQHTSPQEMENALDIQKSRNILKHAVTAWQEDWRKIGEKTFLSYQQGPESLEIRSILHSQVNRQINRIIIHSMKIGISVALQDPSQAEQLRVLKYQSLTGIACPLRKDLRTII